MTKVEWCIVLSIIAIIAAIAIPNFFERNYNGTVAHTKSDLRVVATALESYYSDYHTYPPSSSTFNIIKTHSFYRGQGSEISFENYALTTPVAYLNEMPKDIFTQKESLPFCYYHDFSHRRWVLWSPGIRNGPGFWVHCLS